MKHAQPRQRRGARWCWQLASCFCAAVVATSVVFSSGALTAPALPPEALVSDHDRFAQTVAPQSAAARNYDRLLKKHHFSGVALVVHQNTVILQQGYGSANDQTGQPNTPQSLYPIASLQKNMTATLVMQQIAQGRLSLATPLATFYPNLPDAELLTVQDLLSMATGFEQTATPETIVSEDDDLAFALQHVRVNYDRQRQRWDYQSFNYKLLAGILRQLTGRSVTELTEKFGQSYDLSAVPYKEFVKRPNRTWAYNGGSRQPVVGALAAFSREAGTGNMTMTSGDLYRYYRLLLTNSFASPQLTQSMLTPLPGKRYMSGLYHFQTYHQGHGIIRGAESSVLLSLDGTTAVILLSNNYNDKAPTLSLATELFHQVERLPQQSKISAAHLRRKF